jgi:hypothetical protein
MYYYGWQHKMKCNACLQALLKDPARLKAVLAQNPKLASLLKSRLGH